MTVFGVALLAICTLVLGRISGFGGAPNMGADARGRRHASPSWLKAGREAGASQRRASAAPQNPGVL